MTTPEPLLNMRIYEEKHVIEAIESATAVGHSELDKAAESEALPFVGQFHNATSPAVVIPRTSPDLAHIAETQTNITRHDVVTAKNAFRVEQAQWAAVESYDSVLNDKAVNQSAAMFARSEALNTMANLTKGVLAETFREEKDAEEFRLQAHEFAQAALKSANESIQVAREAQAMIYKVPPKEAQKAEEFILQLTQQAWTLRDEAIKAESLSTFAWQIAKNGRDISAGSVKYAEQVQAESLQAQALAEANAEKLTELHERAQALEIGGSEISGQTLQAMR